MNDRESAPLSSWLLLGFLTLLNFVNFVDRQLITSLQIPLKKSEEELGLNLTDFQVQLLAGYAFSVVYSLAGLFLGTLADRWHRPRLIAAGLLIWSLMTAASGLARDFAQLGLARLFVGIGEATLTPAAVAMIGDVFRPQQRALAAGLYYLGIPLGASFSLIVPNLLLPVLGWRGFFLIMGLVGLLLVGVLLLLRDPPRGGTEGRVVSLSAVRGSSRSFVAILLDLMRTLLRLPSLVMTMIGAVLINIAVGTTWIDPSWLKAERGFSVQGAPIFLGVVLLFGGSLGNFLGGWLGDRFNRRRSGGRLLALVVIQIALLPFTTAFRFLPGHWLVSLAVCGAVGSIFITFMYGPVLATVQELTPVRVRASMIAFLLIWLNIAGASLGSVLAVWLIGVLNSYTWGIFLTSLLALLAIPLFLIALYRYPIDLARRDAALKENLS